MQSVCVYVNIYVQVLTHMHVRTEVRERRMPGVLLLSANSSESGSLTKPGAWDLFPMPPFPHSTGVIVIYMPMLIFLCGCSKHSNPVGQRPSSCAEFIRLNNTPLHAHISFCLST